MDRIGFLLNSVAASLSPLVKKIAPFAIAEAAPLRFEVAAGTFHGKVKEPFVVLCSGPTDIIDGHYYGGRYYYHCLCKTGWNVLDFEDQNHPLRPESYVALVKNFVILKKPIVICKCAGRILA